MPIKELCQIIDHQKISENFYKLTLVSKYISSHGQPGQFINLRIDNTLDPLLRRPFSLHNLDPQKELFEILYEVVGKGTQLLTQKEIKNQIDVMGPLGKGFDLMSDKKFSFLVAGGMGVAPLLALAKELKKRKKQVFVLIGAKNKKGLFLEPVFQALGCETASITDDGSSGKKGLVTELLTDVLSSNALEEDSEIFACGPHPMLKAVAEFALQRKLPAQVSLEEKMACGIGSCMGCVVKTKNNYKRVCADGPVFKSEEIIW